MATETAPHETFTAETLDRPGAIGRAVRIALGVGVLSLLWPLLTVWRAALFAGEVPWREGGFWVLVFLAVWGTSYVFNIAFGLSWGQRTRMVVLLGAVVAGVVGVVASGEFPNAVFGVYLWAWFVALAGLLGPALLLAAALGTPGCEMRSYAHAGALLRGDDIGTAVCPGGIDRFDHIGHGRT